MVWRKNMHRLAAGLWFSPGIPVSSNKTDLYDITEILLKVMLNTITLIKPNYNCLTEP
jgi:Na+-transporting NADH:ubiquinone oxidoreductase subunit NqrB